MKKKPLCSAKTAHGCNPTNQEPYWITSVASLQNTDLIASGELRKFVTMISLSFAKIFKALKMVSSTFGNLGIISVR